jgi:hypothetical protein
MHPEEALQLRTIERQLAAIGDLNRSTTTSVVLRANLLVNKFPAAAFPTRCQSTA